MHGGKSPQVIVAAERRVEVARVERVAQQVLQDRGGAQPMTLPRAYRALLALAGEVDEWRQILRDHVAELQGIRYTSGLGTEQLRAEVQVYERALDRCAKVLAIITTIDPDARLRRLDEEQGQLVVKALNRIFDGLQLSGAQRSLIPSVVPKALREIAAEADE